eukprot:5533477-Pyramimonas_sp.AAC.1
MHVPCGRMQCTWTRCFFAPADRSVLTHGREDTRAFLTLFPPERWLYAWLYDWLMAPYSKR